MAKRDLPSGTVTLLFTDIEGSTRLIDELGEDGYVHALAEHRRILRGVFGDHRGIEVDTQGDAFLYAFADPAGALAAAAQCQQALDVGPVKVRIGLHTGELRLTGEGYAGRELHRAARIAASGHGGQVVLSAATRALVDGELTELGEHRLKDFLEPVRSFQLGRERFPPLKTISNTNLPRPVSSFVGRQEERDRLVNLLRNGTRLITLCGPGGSGKTRLALEAAGELVPTFAAGVFWVGLAALREPALVTETIAQTLGAKNGLAEHIAERDLLLLLDNFEQVVDAAPELGRLLEKCPHLKLMVTSRELLRINGELAYPVPPLAEPEAVELFCERSRLEPDGTIAELCRRLDDLPLALELAAARTSVLSPADILQRLSQRLDLLKGGRDAEPRQQTLRATIEWSFELLSPDEQRLFAHMAVFRGGSTLAAAEEVASATLDSLQSLVDKSLLRHSGQRFWMLEMIREYAGEHLALSGDEADLRRDQAMYVLELAELAYREMDEEGGDQAELLARIAAEHDNLRGALEWARDSWNDEALLRLTAALEYFWAVRGFVQEAETWIPLALERGSAPARARMQVLSAAAGRALKQGAHARADVLIAEWRNLAEQAADEVQVLAARNSAALNAVGKGDLDDARSQFVAIKETAGAIGDRGRVAIATVNLGEVAWLAGDLQASLDYSAEASALFRELGDDGGVIVSLGSCGWNALALSEPVRAEGCSREALIISGRVGAIRRIAVDSAPGLAAALVARHEERSGAQLLAAAAALRAELAIHFEIGLQKQIHDQALADARVALGEEAFAAAWARGEAMTTDDIVEYCASG